MLNLNGSLFCGGKPIDFWNWLAFIKTSGGVLKFTIVLNIIRFIFGLPFLYVVVERLFSILKTVKKIKRGMAQKSNFGCDDFCQAWDEA